MSSVQRLVGCGSQFVPVLPSSYTNALTRMLDKGFSLPSKSESSILSMPAMSVHYRCHCYSLSARGHWQFLRLYCRWDASSSAATAVGQLLSLKAGSSFCQLRPYRDVPFPPSLSVIMNKSKALHPATQGRRQNLRRANICTNGKLDRILGNFPTYSRNSKINNKTLLFPLLK